MKKERLMNELAVFDPQRRSSGFGFEYLVLGPTVYNDPIVMMNWITSLILVVRNQPRGYPHGCTGFQIDHVLKTLRSYFPEAERKGVLVFSSIGSPLDKIHGVDCLFYWRGVIATIDLTLMRQKRGKGPNVKQSRFYLRPEHIGSDERLRQWCGEVSRCLQEKRNTLSLDVWLEFQRNIRRYERVS